MEVHGLQVDSRMYTELCGNKAQVRITPKFHQICVRSLIHHGSGADRFHSSLYVYTSTGSAALCLFNATLLQLRQSGPFRSRYARSLFLPDAKKPRRINLAKFKCTEQTGSQTPIEHHNIWLLVHNKTLTAVQTLRDSLVSPLQLSGSAAPWSTQKAAGGC